MQGLHDPHRHRHVEARREKRCGTGMRPKPLLGTSDDSYRQSLSRMQPPATFPRLCQASNTARRYLRPAKAGCAGGLVVRTAGVQHAHEQALRPGVPFLYQCKFLIKRATRQADSSGCDPFFRAEGQQVWGPCTVVSMVQRQLYTQAYNYCTVQCALLTFFSPRIRSFDVSRTGWAPNRNSLVTCQRSSTKVTSAPCSYR